MTSQALPQTNALEQAWKLISQANKIFLTTHERTDADDFGTVLAIHHVCKKLGKKTTIVVKGGVPPHLQFLPDADKALDGFSVTEATDLYIVSGCSTLDRTGLQGFSRHTPILNLDHHPDNAFFGNVNVVIPSAAAVAEVAYDLFKSTNIPLDQDTALCLLAGLISDTGSFVHSNTTEKSLKTAAALFASGARPGHITKHTFGQKDLTSIKAWGKALANSTFDHQKQMALCIITSRDLAELGNPPLSVFEGFVETLNKVPQAKFALFLKQDGPMVKGSLRSDPHKFGGGIDVSQLAKKYGGGGHKYAAGFAVAGNLIRNPDNSWKILPA